MKTSHWEISWGRLLWASILALSLVLACSDPPPGPNPDGTTKDGGTDKQPVKCSTDADCANVPGKPKCSQGTCEPECTLDVHCKNPSKPKCDTTQGLCVPQTEEKCTTDADCKDPQKPKCDTATGQCFQCLTDADCASVPNRPVCVNGVCDIVPPPQCTQDSDCIDPALPRCDPATGRCVPECTTDTDCKDPALPKCDPKTNKCVPSTPTGCKSDADCTTDPQTPKCETSSGKCVQCLTDADCNAPNTVCLQNKCQSAPPVRCKSDADCKDPALPKCDTASGQCVPAPPSCTTDADCKDPQKPKCDASSQTCVECLANTDCKDPQKPICRKNRCEAKAPECATDADCKDPQKPVCRGGLCEVECKSDADCKDPAQPKCKNNKCTPECTSDADCKDPAQPKCDTAIGKCVPSTPTGCKSDADCKAPTPKCNTSNGLCVECLTNTHCSSKPGRPLCDKRAGKCKAECATDADCKDPQKPRCDVVFGRCDVECRADADCKDPAQPKCKNNKCAPECATDADCKDPQKPVCLKGLCSPKQGCKSDADCKDPQKTHCHISSGNCYPCVTDAHCPAWKACDVSKHVCLLRPGRCDSATNCADPGKKYCLNHSCVECTQKSHCRLYHDCVSGVCKYVGCQNDAECPNTYCEPNSKKCVACYLDKHCASNQICDKASFTCKLKPGCSSDNDCPQTKPACKTTTRTCVECTNDSYCATGYKCDTSKNLCVNCLTDANCTKPNPSPPYQQNTTQICLNYKCASACRQDTDCVLGYICQSNKCVSGCRSNRDCPSSLPICNTTTKKCVQCLVDRDCPTGYACNTTNNTCQLSCRSNSNSDGSSPDCTRPYNRCIYTGSYTPTCFCRSSACVECLTNTHCSRRYSQSRPVCQKNNVCGCLSDAQCKPLPNSTRGICRTTAKPAGECIGCLKDTDCRTGYICSSSNTCESGCRTDNDCPRGKYCSNSQCVDCTQNSHCSAPTAVCDTKSGRCVECLSTSDCKTGETCYTTSNICIGTTNRTQCEPCSAQNQCAANHTCITATFYSGISERVCLKRCRTNSDCSQGYACGSSRYPTLRNYCWPAYGYRSYSIRSCRAVFDQGKSCTSYSHCGQPRISSDAFCSTLEGNHCRVYCDSRDSNSCLPGYKCSCPPGYSYDSRYNRCTKSGSSSTYPRCTR